MEKSRKKGMFFLAGIVVGAAAGFYINSDGGRKVRRQAGESINKFGEDVTVKTREQFNHLSENVNEVYDRGKTYVDDVRSSIRTRINKAGNDTITLTRQEMARAKKKINKGIRRLEEMIETEIG